MTNKNFTNTHGTTSRYFQIGKDGVVIETNESGFLNFNVYERVNGEQELINQWKLDYDNNAIHFPNGQQIEIDEETKKLLFKIDELTSIELSVVEDGKQAGALNVTQKFGDEIVSFKIGVNDTRSGDNYDFDVNKIDIPTTWAVWNAIKRVKEPIESRLNDIEEAVGIIFDPGNWDEQ